MKRRGKKETNSLNNSPGVAPGRTVRPIQRRKLPVSGHFRISTRGVQKRAFGGAARDSYGHVRRALGIQSACRAKRRVQIEYGFDAQFLFGWLLEGIKLPADRLDVHGTACGESGETTARHKAGQHPVFVKHGIFRRLRSGAQHEAVAKYRAADADFDDPGLRLLHAAK